MLGKEGDPAGNADGGAGAIGQVDAGRAQEVLQFLRDDGGLGQVGLGQHQGHLIAAKAGQEVGGAQVFGQDGGHLAEHIIASLVAIGIVDQLEPVQVHHDDAEGVAGGL